MRKSIDRYTRYEIGSRESLHEMDVIIECIERIIGLIEYIKNK